MREPEPGGPVEQRHIYPPRVRGLEVNDFVIQLVQGCVVQEPLKRPLVLHLRHAYHVRQAALLPCRPQDALCDGLALGVELPPAPMPLSEAAELCVRGAGGVVPVVEEVLQVPEHHPQGVPTLTVQSKLSKQPKTHPYGQHPSSHAPKKR